MILDFWKIALLRTIFSGLELRQAKIKVSKIFSDVFRGKSCIFNEPFFIKLQNS